MNEDEIEYYFTRYDLRVETLGLSVIDKRVDDVLC